MLGRQREGQTDRKHPYSERPDGESKSGHKVINTAEKVHGSCNHCVFLLLPH